MVWGVERGSCCEDLLKPLGLISYGGGSRNGKQTYRVHSITKTNNFEYEIDFDKIEEIGDIYLAYLRKNKIEHLNELNRRNKR